MGWAKIRKIGVLSFLAILLLASPSAIAATKYWIGSAGGNFSSNSNWSTTSAGGNDTTAPGSADIATFDAGANTNCTIDGTVSLAGVEMKSGYTATLTQSAAAQLTVGTSHWVQADGTFTGGSKLIDINGYIKQTAGVFTATSGSMTLASDATFTGTFNHNNGKITFDSNGNKLFDVNGTASFYSLEVNKTNGETITILTNDVIVVENDLALTNGKFDKLGTANIDLRGTLTQNSNSDGGTAPVNITGSNTRSFTLANGGSLPPIVMDSTNTTMNGGSSSTLTMSSIDMRHGTFTGGAGAVTFTNASVMSDGTFTNGGGTFTFSSTFTQSGGTFGGGSGSLDMNGDLTVSNGTFNATSGLMTVADDATFSGGTFNHTNGTIRFDGSADKKFFDVNGTITLYNLGIAKSNNGHYVMILNNDTVIVENDLSLGIGKFMKEGTSNIDLRGTISQPNPWHDGGDIILNITGGNTRSFTLANGGSLPNIVMNAANCTMNGNASSTVTMSSIDMRSGIFTGGNGAITFTNASVMSGGTFTNGGGTLTFSSTFNQSGGTFGGGSGALDMNGDLTVSNGTFNATSGTMTVADDATFSGGTFNHTNGTITFDGSAGGKVFDVNGNITLYNLGIAKSNNAASVTINSNDTVIVENTLSLGEGQFDKMGASNIDLRGTISMPNTWYDGGSILINITGAGTRSFTLANGGLLPDIVMNAADCTMNGGSSGTTTINSLVVQAGRVAGGAGGITFTNASGISGGTFTNAGGTLTFSGTFTQSGGTFGGGSGTLDMNGDLTVSSGTFNASSGSLTIADDATFTGGTFNHNNGTTTIDGSAGGKFLDVNSSITFYNLNFSKSNNTTLVTILNNDVIQVANTLTLSEGLVSSADTANPGILEALGNVSVSTNYDGGTATLRFAGSANQTFDPSTTGNLYDGDVVVNKSAGEVSLTRNWSCNTANQDLTIQEGTFDLNGFSLTNNGSSATVVVESGGTLQLMGGETTTLNATYPQMQSGSTVSYDGTSTYTIKDWAYDSIAANGTGVYQMGSNETLGGGLTINSGTFDLNSRSLTVTGAFQNAGTLRLQGGEATASLTMDTDSGTVAYNGTSTYSSLKLGNAYNNLSFTGSGTFDHNASLDVNGNLTVGATSKFRSNGQSINVFGNWANTGTYTSGINTVTLDGTGSGQTISGTTTFNNLSKTVTTAQTLTLPSATATRIDGTATFYGANGALLSLRSDSTTVASSVNFNGTESFKYLDVKDNNNTNASQVICNSACIDSTGNTNWSFTAPNVSYASASSSGAESVTSPNLAVNLSASMLVDATVGYAVSGGSATGTGTDYTLTSGTLTIPAGATSANITPTVVNDTLDETDETITVALSSPTNSTLGATASTSYAILDDDNPPTVEFSATSSNGAESSSPTITVSLSATSGRTVTVDYAVTSGTATGSGTDYTLSAGTVTINAGSVSGTITPTIINDVLDENDETLVITLSNAGNSSLGGNTAHTYTITDDDATPATQFAVTSSNGLESVASPAITVSLATTSGRNVTVDYTLGGTASGSGVDYTLAAGTATINAGSVTTTITPTITGDTLDENDETIILTISNPVNTSLGGNTQHTYTITDDDAAPSVQFSTATSSGVESSSPTITVSLATTSGKSVTVDYALSGTATGSGTDYTLSAGTATINAGSISTTITPTITGDTLDESDETLILTLSNPVNSSLGGNTTHTYTITDDDAAPSIQFSATTSSGAESSSPTITLSISATSAKTVTVDYALGGTSTGSGTDYTLTAGTATINAGNVSTTITPTITGDVLDEDNETLILTISNPGNATLGGNTTYTYTITDDDATPTVTFTASSQSVAEDVGTATVTAQLSAVSGRNVTVPFTLGGTATGSSTDYSITASPVTVTAGATTTTITVTVTNDSRDENDETVIVTMGAPTNASQGATTTHTATITDNDTVGTTIAESGGSVVITEGSVTDTYTVVLTSEPSGDVTITPAPNAQVTVAPTTLTFTSANWSTPQTITVTPVNDSVAEGSHTGSITHTSASSDSSYNGLSISTVTPQITDNDTAGVSRSETSGSTAATEGGTTDSYTFVLTSEPTSTVTVTLSGTQVSTSTATLTFTTANWSSAQTITVTATDDSRIEGNHNGTITHTVTSSDSNYNGISVSNLTVAVTDNDSAGVSVTQSSGSTVVTEVGNTDDYTLVLTSQPTGDVTISVTTDAQLTATPSTVTFTNSNWSTPQTVSVTAVNDNRKDSIPSSTITHAITTSADANFTTGLAINSVVVTITDNDSVGVTIAESSNATGVTEGSGSDTYTIVLVSEPTATVTVTPTAGTGLSVTPSSVAFTGANWNVPQTITVTAANDNTAAANRSVSITHSISSSDADYAALTVSSVSVSVTDAGAVSDTDTGTSTGTGTGTSTDSGGSGETNTAPTVNAGSDQTVVPGATVSLFALASDADNDAITYVWTETTGKSVTIDNATSSAASVTFGSDAVGTYVFSVTVNDGTVGVSDIVIVNVLKKEISVTEFGSGKKSGKVLVNKGGKKITATLTDSSTSVFSYLPRYMIDLEDGAAAVISSIDGVTAGIGDVIHLAVPLAGNGAGRVYAIDKASLTKNLICLECDLDGVAGVSVADGENADALFGYTMQYGDLNGDGTDELIVAAPGSENGELHILNQRTLAVEMKLIGSSERPVQSSGLSIFDMNGDGIDDIIFIKNALSSAQLHSDLLASSFTVTSDESQYMGILGSESLPEVFDLSVDDPDFTGTSESSLSSMASGDVNDDGYADLITASAQTCEVEIYFGSDEVGSESTDMASDVTFSCDMTTSLSDMVVGDVNGDGIDDLIFGFPDEDSGFGSIQIILGVETWEEGYDFSQAVSVTGDESEDIADWLLLGDDNDDGIDDIYTNLGANSTYVISLAEMAEVSATDAGSSAAAGCSLNKAAARAAPTSFFMMALLGALLVLGRRTLFNNR